MPCMVGGKAHTRVRLPVPLLHSLRQFSRFISDIAWPPWSVTAIRAASSLVRRAERRGHCRSGVGRPRTVEVWRSGRDSRVAVRVAVGRMSLGPGVITLSSLLVEVLASESHGCSKAFSTGPIATHHCTYMKGTHRALDIDSRIHIHST